MKNENYIYGCRLLLGLSQVSLAKELGWSSGRMVSMIETGERPLQIQTKLALECLIRRAGKFKQLESVFSD
jgi:transcriptional regulator with XRE-family HTH domain